MRHPVSARRVLAPLTLALTLAACGSQAPTTTAPAASQDGPSAGATVQEYAASPILPISTLPETLEKHPGLRDFLKKKGQLDGLLAQAARAKNGVSAQATAGTCTPVRWLAELSGKLRAGSTVKCSVPFAEASVDVDFQDYVTSPVYDTEYVAGDGRKTAVSNEASIALRPNWVFYTSWAEFVQFPDGSYWFGPQNIGNYYTSSGPGIRPRTPQTLSGRTFKQGGGTLLAYAELKWTYPPPATFLAKGNRIYDVTTDRRVLIADNLTVSERAATVLAGTSAPGLKRRYQVCIYNLFEELCSNTLSLKWDGNQAPTAAFTATPLTGDFPLRVNFDASTSRDPDGRIVSFGWNFNETAPAEELSGVTTSHTFESPGEYEVSLTVTDEDGNKGTVTRTVTVTDPAPTLSATASRTDVGGVGHHRVELSWTPARGIDVASYTVYRELGSEYGETVIQTLPASQTSTTDDLGATGEFYALYKVCGVSTQGEELCGESSFVFFD